MTGVFECCESAGEVCVYETEDGMAAVALCDQCVRELSDVPAVPDDDEYELQPALGRIHPPGNRAP